jgi:hypothetical protein
MGLHPECSQGYPERETQHPGGWRKLPEMLESGIALAGPSPGRALVRRFAMLSALPE